MIHTFESFIGAFTKFHRQLIIVLRIVDEVLSDGTGRLTKFVGWMEYSSNAQTDMIEIETEDGEHLTLTGTHNVFYYEDGKPTPTYAKNLSPGNVIVGVGGSGKVVFAY